jgi:uncharacterized membrane protein (DUF106 family)
MISTAVHLGVRPGPAFAVFSGNTALALVLALSVVVGLLIVLAFRYTSNQPEIRRTKDQLKAHLLAVRLFQDQLPVVLHSYSRILRGTAHYIRLAFTPLLFVIVPLVFLMAYVDHYLGWMPVRPEQQFLVQVKTNSADLDDVSLQVPPEMTISAPPVHIPDKNEVVWRVVASQDGAYEIKVALNGESVSKQVAAAHDLRKLSTTRLRNHFWTRLFVSTEPAIPAVSLIDSIEVQYPERNIALAGFEFNWIILFFVFSLAAGWIFKTVLRIEV